MAQKEQKGVLADKGWYPSDAEVNGIVAEMVAEMREEIEAGNCESVECRLRFIGRTIIDDKRFDGRAIIPAFGNRKERIDAYAQIGEQLVMQSDGSPTLVCHGSEAWGLKVEPGHSRDEYPDDISSAPGREELVVVSALSFDGKRASHILFIGRDQNGMMRIVDEETLLCETGEAEEEEQRENAVRVDDHNLAAFFAGVAIGTLRWMHAGLHEQINGGTNERG